MTLAMITARGGSKRIPGKNIRAFAGQPILSYPILAALRADCFDEVMVSTEDPEIAETAKRFGAAVPFLRSAKTASDTATTDEVIAEVLTAYKEAGKAFDRFVCIYPTAAFLTEKRLLEAVALLDTHESVMSVAPYNTPPQRALVLSESGTLVRKYPAYQHTRSQDLETMYRDCGMFYACRTDAFFRGNTTDVADLFPVILGAYEYLDIDTEEDFLMAERIWNATMRES